MFENPGLLMVLCLVLILGLGFPISALMAARKGQLGQEISLYKRLATRARNPWITEDEALDELSKRVEDLESEKEVDGEEDG